MQKELKKVTDSQTWNRVRHQETSKGCWGSVEFSYFFRAYEQNKLIRDELQQDLNAVYKSREEILGNYFLKHKVFYISSVCNFHIIKNLTSIFSV